MERNCERHGLHSTYSANNNCSITDYEKFLTDGACQRATQREMHQFKKNKTSLACSKGNTF